MGWIVKPPSFDASKKYPLILEIHGGPFANYNVGFNYMFQNFAANGFVVLVTNPRGSTGYGSEFINGIDHNYPGPDYDDLMAGVDTVVGKGYVDTSRMYVSGCSGGGVLSSWVIGHTDRFAAAAVRCPVIDWLSMAGQTDIPLFTYSFFKKPFWEDPSDWLAHSSLMTVGKVTTPTLLMTGVLDRRTPMPQTEEYYAALKVKGVPVKLLQFNEEYHGTGSKPSNYIRTQLYMMSWFNRYTRQAGGRITTTAAATVGATTASVSASLEASEPRSARPDGLATPRTQICDASRCRSLCARSLGAHAVVAQQPAPGPVTAIRAGRLLDPEAGRDPHQPDHPRRGHAHPRRRAERRDSRRRAGDRPVADDGAARPRRGAQPSGAHLQAGAREQHLLLHLRAGIDGAARDSGRVERHPDARRPASPSSATWATTATTPTPRCGRRSSRAGFPVRRSSTPGSSSAAWAGSSSRRPRWRRTTTSSIPEYLDADTPDEIVKAVRQNVLFGAKVIKICVDCKPYGYTADEIRLFIREAAKAGMKVEGHVQTANGARQRDRGRHLVDRAFRRR